MCIVARKIAPHALTTLLLVALVGGPAIVAAQARSIPVKTGVGTLNKSGKRNVKSTGSVGVFKRKKVKSKLDPKYDPAKVGKKVEPDRPKQVAAAPKNSGGSGNTPAAGLNPARDPNEKSIEDIITVKNNFTDIKCVKLPKYALVTLDFEQAPLESITKLMSCWMNRNFLIATARRGAKVTILSPQPVTVIEAYRAFLSMLNVNGMTIAKRGKIYHIIDANQARPSGTPVIGLRGAVPDDDGIVTRLIRLEHIEAKEVQTLLQKFKSKGGDIFTYEANNTLIITDTGSSIRRMMKLLKDVDVPLGKEKIWIRPVQHMGAKEILEKVNAVFDSKGTTTTRRRRGRPAANGGSSALTTVKITKAIADERTNQLILICTRTSYLKVDALIRKLDVPIPGEGQIHIHRLENADAEDLASTLSSLASGGGAKSGGTARRGAAKGKSGGSAALFEGDVKITAHKATNALVIEASLKDYLSLTKVIDRLDRRRKQVYVEAVIMEISTSKNRTMQIAGSAGTTFDIGGETIPFLVGLGGLGMGGVDLSQLQSGGLAAGMQGPLLQVDTGNTGQASVGAGVTLSIPAFGFLVQAIQENSDVNVLSTPHILTLNNEDAEIQVGRKVPYRSASLGGLGGLGALSGLAGGAAGGALGGLGSALGGLGGGTMVQHVDVDLTLKITPQINESDFVKLKIEEQLDEIEAMDPNLGPTTSKRKVSNTVVVRDQQPVVIGGLITDRESTGVAKIPILGDLPLIGMLFRKSTKRVEKKNLQLIIVPHIIKDPSDLRRIHEEKMNQIREFADALATRRKEYDGKIDFRKKTGVLQNIYREVEKAAKERKLMEKAYYDNAEVDLVGPPEHHDLDYDPFAKRRGERKRGRHDRRHRDHDEDEDGDDDEYTEDASSGVQVIELPDAPKKAATPAKSDSASDTKPDTKPDTSDKADKDDKADKADKSGKSNAPGVKRKADQ